MVLSGPYLDAASCGITMLFTRCTGVKYARRNSRLMFPAGTARLHSEIVAPRRMQRCADSAHQMLIRQSNACSARTMMRSIGTTVPVCSEKQRFLWRRARSPRDERALTVPEIVSQGNILSRRIGAPVPEASMPSRPNSQSGAWHMGAPRPDISLIFAVVHTAVAPLPPGTLSRGIERLRKPGRNHRTRFSPAVFENTDT
jgi:hypothetical protein